MDKGKLGSLVATHIVSSITYGGDVHIAFKKVKLGLSAKKAWRNYF